MTTDRAVPITLSMPLSLIERITTEAAKTSTTPSALVRELVRRELDAKEARKTA